MPETVCPLRSAGSASHWPTDRTRCQRGIVTDFLCGGLSFDKYEDLTTECQVRGEFADYGIRVDRQMIGFIEARSKEAITHRLLDELWQAKAATSPRSLARIVLSENVIEAIRKELRRQTSYNGDPAELAAILKNEVLRTELEK
jgi:hypothetical protein